MPQIWLSYEELAALLDCDIPHARTAAAAMRLDRRRSRDGTSRAKLTSSLATAYLDRILRQRFEQEVAARAGDLRATYERMAERAPTLRHPSALAS